MIVQTFENKELSLKSHVIMMRLNGKIHYGVDIYKTDAKEFVPHVEFFKTEKKATNYAKICVA